MKNSMSLFGHFSNCCPFYKDTKNLFYVDRRIRPVANIYNSNRRNLCLNVSNFPPDIVGGFRISVKGTVGLISGIGRMGS